MHKFIEVKEYLEKQLNHKLTLPKVIKEEMCHEGHKQVSTGLKNCGFITEYRAGGWRHKSKEITDYEKENAMREEEGSVMGQKR